MNKLRVIVLGAASAALIAAIFVINDESPAPASPAARSATPTANDAPVTASNNVGITPASEVESSAETDTRIDDGQIFHMDVAGNLVADEQTRLNIEALIAQTNPRERDEAIRDHTESLSPAAARTAAEWVDKFVSYQEAQRQNYPPDADTPTTFEDAARQLESLHALREAHFGSKVANGFYGREEIIACEMIEIMRVENDQSLTPDERTERARVLRERLPGVSAIEKNNRDGVPTEH